MNATMLGGLAAATVALTYGRARRRRTLLEVARERYVAHLGGDPSGEARAALELDQGRIARAIRELPELDPVRLTFIDSTDPYPYLAAGEIGVLENFLVPREMVQREFSALLDEGIEHYRHEERAALNPLTWLGKLLFLPRELLDFVGLYGVGTERLTTLAQLLYWLGILAAIGVAGMALLAGFG